MTPAQASREPARHRRTIGRALAQAARAVDAASDLLTRARADYERMRVCALPICGRLFLAERRTRLYCSRAHASLASVHAFRKRERKTRQTTKRTRRAR